MHWIIDLLIDKLNKKEDKEWQPEPLWIEIDNPMNEKQENEESESEKKVIVIDL